MCLAFLMGVEVQEGDDIDGECEGKVLDDSINQLFKNWCGGRLV